MKCEGRLYVTELQTARSVLVSNLGFFLILSLGVIWRSPAFFLLLILYIALIEWCRSRVCVFLDEQKGRLSVTAPLLGYVHFELDSFQDVMETAPDLLPRIWEAVFFLLAGFLMISEAYHFSSGEAIKLSNLLVAAMLLVFAFSTRRRRGHKSLRIQFGMYSDWRRYLWPQRKVTLHGPEEVLRELKRQVEVAVGLLGTRRMDNR